MNNIDEILQQEAINGGASDTHSIDSYLRQEAIKGGAPEVDNFKYFKLSKDCSQFLPDSLGGPKHRLLKIELPDSIIESQNEERVLIITKILIAKNLLNIESNVDFMEILNSDTNITSAALTIFDGLSELSKEEYTSMGGR